jgi:hypothetical protein
MFEDTKVVFKSCKSKNDRQYNDIQMLHRKFIIEQHESGGEQRCHGGIIRSI